MPPQWRSTGIPGLFRTTRETFRDSRGSFTKVLGEGDESGGQQFRPREIFWSSSTRGVFRGMHVPLPPHAARKLVFVTHGRVRDLIVDLRRGSPTEGQLWETELDEDSGGIVIPQGCAHGFEVLSDGAAMVYAQEDFFHPDADGGILFSSVGVSLVSEDPVISDRDLALPTFDDFENPFVYA